MPYDEGAGPSVQPDIRPPDDFAHIDAKPEQFGALIGQGVEKAGAGAVQASNFYGQIAADDVMNNYVSQTNKRLYGDPNTMVQQPDGTTAPDTGYFGKKGADQLAARAQLQKDMDADYKQYRGQLQTPESQFNFDSYSRRYRLGVESRVGESSERAYTEWGVKTAQGTIEQAAGDAARHADDDAVFNGVLENAKAGAVKVAQLQGLTGDAVKASVGDTTSTLWKMRVETIGVNDPARAYKMAQEHQSDLGKLYPSVADGLRTRSDQVTGAAIGDKVLADARVGGGTAVAAGTPVAPVAGDPNALKTRVQTVKPAGPDCVPLVQAVTGAPSTDQWVRGANALAARPPIGTAVATFMNRDGSPSDRYDGGVGHGIRGNNTTHAGIIAGYTADGGMVLWEQYVGSGGPKQRTYYPSGTGEQNASNYFTIKTGQAGGPSSYPAMGGGIVQPAGAANASMPVSSPGGMAAYKQRVGQIENPAGDPNATSPTGARGFFQWVGSTAKQYGVIPGNRDSEQKGMDRLSADNLAVLNKGLGREATPEELYLAHQQGAGGALQLLQHPTERAGDIVGDAAIRNNGGDPNASAAQFVNLWKAKYDRVQPGPAGAMPPGHEMPGGGNSGNLPIVPTGLETGAAGAAPSTVTEPPAPPAPPAPAEFPHTPTIEEAKAAAIATVESRGDLSMAQKAAARSRIVEQAAEAMISEQETQRQKKEREDKQANGYLQRIHSGTGLTGMVQQIANDQYIADPKMKEWLIDIAERKSGDDTEEMKVKGGGDYWNFYKRVTAYPGDPTRLSDEREVYQAVAEHRLTVAGGNDIIGTMAKMRKSDESASFQRSVASLKEYAKKEMSRDGDMAIPGIPQSMQRDPKGEAKFYGEFVPKLESTIETLEKGGKDPWSVIDKKAIDDMMESVYPK